MTDTVEMAIAGPENTVRAFVSGFLAGEELPDDAILIASDHGIETESILERLAEIIRLKDNVEFLLADDAVADELENKIKAMGKQLQMAVRSRRVVRSATLKFKYAAYNRELGDRLDALIQELAAKLKLSNDYAPVSRVDPEAVASGVELYSPVHDLEIRAAGSFTGPVRDVIAARNRLAAEEMVELEPIELLYEQ